ncbi:MAG TPA: glycosyltransferase family 1 protein [candidate division WOR-3 bacterium]|uniref:Glycosyltransferase family 1 protein n=1 Tax=candidate division WOR-3 bacterium TaxID=2052148 RepID=A0A9C9ELB1_UNCW3|nr:glycosyltransferase family 1 protein [candidate division WOR-3 bacterium]
MNQIKKRYKICQIVRHAQIAGTEKHVFLLAENMSKEYFDINVCTFEHGVLVDRLKAQGVNTYVIPYNHIITHFLKLIKFLRRHKFDIVHSHSGGYACIAAKIAGCKRIIYTKHGVGFTLKELKKISFIRKMRNWIIDRCVDVYIALTKHDKLILRKFLNIPSRKVVVIYNGVPDISFKETGKKRFEDRPVVGTVARLVKQKGIEYLIKAVPLIRDKYKNLSVLIVGCGSEEEHLKDLVHRYGLEKTVRFLGYIENPLEIISSFDVFLLPSLWEGFPYVLLEAMYLKKPIVATDIFGIKEVIENNKSGILVKVRSPESISEAVLYLLGNREKALKLGESAYKRVLSCFSLEKTIAQIERLYYTIIKNKRFSQLVE